MELRAADGERMADKTVLRMMREMGLRCGIRRETDHHRYNSYRGEVGETFENVLGRDFEGARPVMHSDMGWQYQHATYVEALAENGFVQSMSRKGNCIDNGATEQVFGHIKDEFFRGRDWETFEGFKRGLEAYIHHWNNVRRQVKLKGLTPVEFREQALREAA